MAIVLQYATLAQLGRAFRERYLDQSNGETWRLAAWMINRIEDGTVTEAQVQAFFNLTPAQWNTLKTKWQDWKVKYDEMKAAKGE